MKIYISGKVSGLDLEEARAKFQLAEVRLRKGGFDPVNPMKINPTPGLTWEEYMVEDIKHLFKCKSILMLPCWGESKGARIERAIALEHGIAVVYMDDKFLGKLFINAISDRVKDIGKDAFLDQDWGHGHIAALADTFEINHKTALQLVLEYKEYGLY